MTCVTRLIGLLFILDVCAGGVVSIWDEERKFCGSDFENARHLACYGVNSPFKKSHFGQYEEKDNAREEELVERSMEEGLYVYAKRNAVKECCRSKCTRRHIKKFYC
jgi:hypothetical protein